MTNLLRKLCLDYSKPLTLILLVLCSISLYLGSDLKLKLSLTDLLPDDHPSVKKFEKITEIVGGVGYLIVVLKAQDKNSYVDVAKNIQSKISQNPLVRSAFIEREEYFFSTRMLYYLNEDRLLELESTIVDKITKAKRKVFDLGLWDEEEKKSTKEIDPKVTEQAKKTAKVTPLLQSEDLTHLLVMIKPSFDSFDLGKTKQLISEVKEVLSATIPSHMSYELAGRYYDKIEDSRVIEKDIYFLGLLSLALIAVCLFFYLSIKEIIFVSLPVLMGVFLTVGLTKIFIGHINIVTGFLMGILSGLGMDYSVHMMLRLKMEVGKSENPVWETLKGTGHSIFVGSLSAAMAFYLLCFSSFRAFSEFGFVCGTGTLAVAYCLLFCFSAWTKWFGLDKNKIEKVRPFKFPALPVLKGGIFVPAILVSIALLIVGTQVGFEYDFSKMLQHSKKVVELNQLINDIYGRSVSPSVVSIPERELAVDTENYLKEKYVPNTLQLILSGATIIPDNQLKKREILKRIERKISNIKPERLEKEVGIPAEAIKRWVKSEPFKFEDLPVHLQDAFRGTKKSDYLMYIYPSVDISTLGGVTQFAQMIRDIVNKFQRVLTGSDAVVFREILDLIEKDGLLILAAIFVMVGLILWLNLRRVDETLLTYLPLIIALPIGMGLMYLFKVRFNIFNIAVIPSFVAIGIDVPIHIVHRSKELGSGFKAAKELASSINLALSTTALGFGVLIFARAGVLRSLGWLAILGTLAIWWVGLFLLPAILERWKFFKTPVSKPPTVELNTQIR